MSDEDKKSLANKQIEFGKFSVYHIKIANDQFLLIELENSGIIKLKYSKDGVNVILYNSSSLESIQGLYVAHTDFKK